MLDRLLHGLPKAFKRLVKGLSKASERPPKGFYRPSESFRKTFGGRVIGLPKRPWGLPEAPRDYKEGIKERVHKEPWERS